MNKLMRSSPLKNNSSAMNTLMHPVTVEESILQKKAYLSVSRASVNSTQNLANNGLLTKHQNTHNDLPCEKCPKHFGAKRNMKKHMANVHKDDKEVSEKGETPKSVNIAHLGLTNVDVGDLLVMPLQALPSVDPLPVDPFLVDPLPIDDFYNDSFPIDLLPADLDQAFMLPNND